VGSIPLQAPEKTHRRWMQIYQIKLGSCDRGLPAEFCREAALDHRPGLQPWVGCLKAMCPERGTRGSRESSRQRTIPELTTFGRHFQGAFINLPTQG
jgi:hypothetical protein